MSQGRVDDLIERCKRGEITSKEAHAELKKRGLVESERWEIIPWVIYFILCLAPSLSELPQLGFLRFLSELERFYFPSWVIYTSIAIIVLGIILVTWVYRSHLTRGGLRKGDETLIFYREGPYRIIRHPAVAGGMIAPILLPFILSDYVLFTYLSIGAIAVLVIYTLYGVHSEEKLSIEKWGDEYRQYMKEVPGFNIILGLWRLRSRGKRA